MGIFDSFLPTGTSDLVSGATSMVGKAVNTALNIFDPSAVRLQVAGLFKGGAATTAPAGVSGYQINPQTTTPTATDWRVRVSLPDNSPLFYNSYDESNIQSILYRTNGVIFPYTPSITVSHSARYQEQALTHSNYKNYFYDGSDVSAIQVQGEFTVQNWDDGQYLLAAIYFFRSCTKMFVGGDNLAGNPPPIVYLDGYGDFYFPHVSCVVTNFSHTMPAEVDYVEVPVSMAPGGQPSGSTGQMARLPTTSQISVTLQPVYSRRNTHDNFTLTDFSSGKLLAGNGGFL